MAFSLTLSAICLLAIITRSLRKTPMVIRRLTTIAVLATPMISQPSEPLSSSGRASFKKRLDIWAHATTQNSLKISTEFWKRDSKGYSAMRKIRLMVEMIISIAHWKKGRSDI